MVLKFAALKPRKASPRGYATKVQERGTMLANGRKAPTDFLMEYFTSVEAFHPLGGAGLIHLSVSSVVDAFRERTVFVTLRRAREREGEQEEMVLRSLSTLRSTATEDGRLLVAILIAFFRFKQVEIQPAADPGSTIFRFAVLPFQRLRLRGRCKRA